MIDNKQSVTRQEKFAKAWFGFLRECRNKNIRMNQTIAAEGLKIKRSTFSHSVNYGPSDTVILRFARYTGIPPEQIDETLFEVKPIMLHVHDTGYCEPLKKAS